VALISGALCLLIAIPTYVSSLTSYSSNGGSTALVFVAIGVLLLSAATTIAIGWFFAVTMANHAEVVYFSSSSNKDRKEPVATVAPVAQPTASGEWALGSELPK